MHKLQRCASVLVLVLGLGVQAGPSAGAEDQPYVARPEPAPTLRLAQRYPVLAVEAGETVRIPLVFATGVGGSARAFTQTSALRDYVGTTVATRRGMVQVAANEREVAFHVLYPLSECGWYSVAVQVKDGNGREVAAGTYGVAAVPKPREVWPEQSFFGVNTHFAHGLGDVRAVPELLALAGFRWVREPLYWGGVERKAGEYAIDLGFRGYLTALRRRGMDSLVCLMGGCEFHDFKTPQGAEAYGRLAEFAARNLAELTSAFELWNEPHAFGNITPDQYVPLLAAGADGVHRGNPTAVAVGVGGGEPGGWSAHYLVPLMEAGVVGKMDTFSIHPYMSPHTPEFGYRTIDAPVPLASLLDGPGAVAGAPQAIAQARGLSRPVRVWVTEIGWPTGEAGEKSPCVSLGVQAAALARMYLTGATVPDFYQRIFLYDFICDGEDPRNMEHNFGVVNHDLTLRPSFVAVAAAAQAIDGRPYLRRLDCRDASIQAHLFGPTETPTLCAWVTELTRDEAIRGAMADGSPARYAIGSAPERRAELRLSVIGRPERIVVRDWQWRVLPIHPKAGSLTLPLTPWPLYVQGFEAAREKRQMNRVTPEPACM